MTLGNYESHHSKGNYFKEGALLGALSLTLAAYMADSHVGARGRHGRTDKADVVSNVRPGEHALFAVPGYHANGRVIGKNLDRHLESIGTTHYAVHPETGFSLDSIRDAWLQARQKDGHRPAKIYAMSMGALLVDKMFSDEGFRKEFGEVDAYVIDSGLSGKKDVCLSSKLAMAAGALLPLTYTTGKLYSLVTSREIHHKIIDHASEVTDEEAYEHILSSTKTTFDAAKDQIFFMDHNSVDKMNLEAFANEVRGPIVYLASPRDDVLNPHRSAQEHSDAFQRDIEYWIDTSRAVGTHATGPEHPQSIKDALLYENRGNYRVKTVRHHETNTSSRLWVPRAA